MRILVHDYCGHAFPMQLSKNLSNRNFEVLHLFSSNFETPKGQNKKNSQSLNNFKIIAIDLNKKFPKYSYFKRLLFEKEYSNLLYSEVEKFNPDVIISSQTPLLIQKKSRIIVKSIKGNLFFGFRTYWV